MDLQLYLRVIWRFRILVAAGMLLAIALALLSYVRVDFDGGKPSFTYRQSEKWESLAQVNIGAGGPLLYSSIDPETRALLDTARTPEEAREILKERDPAAYANLSFLLQLTLNYMALATGDDVMNIMQSDGQGPVRGALQTFPVRPGEVAEVPMITFSAIAASPEEAYTLSRRHVTAFKKYVKQEQVDRGVPRDERVEVTDVKASQPAVLLEPRKKTTPIVVFITGMIAVLGLAFILENLRPRVRPVPGEEEKRPPLEARRSA